MSRAGKNPESFGMEASLFIREKCEGDGKSITWGEINAISLMAFFQNCYFAGYIIVSTCTFMPAYSFGVLL